MLAFGQVALRRGVGMVRSSLWVRDFHGRDAVKPTPQCGLEKPTKAMNGIGSGGLKPDDKVRAARVPVTGHVSSSGGTRGCRGSRPQPAANRRRSRSRRGLPIERRPHRMRGQVVLGETRGELWVGRNSGQCQPFGRAPGFIQVGPRHARPRRRRAQVVAPVVLEHEASDRQAVRIVEGMVTMTGVSAPAAIGKTAAGG
jgi:hypothetical protein